MSRNYSLEPPVLCDTINPIPDLKILRNMQEMVKLKTFSESQDYNFYFIPEIVV